MLRYLIFVALALVACAAEPEPEAVVVPPVVVERPAAVTTTTVDVDAVALWNATVLWNSTVTWNEAVAQNEREAAEAASRRVATPSSADEASPSYTGSGVWYALAECESGGDWSYNGSSDYDGGLQFHPGTWSAYAPAGYPAYAWQASVAQQIAVAERVLAAQGWGAWPACSRALGLR